MKKLLLVSCFVTWVHVYGLLVMCYFNDMNVTCITGKVMVNCVKQRLLDFPGVVSPAR